MNLTNRIKNAVNKFTHRSDKSVYNQADGRFDFEPEKEDILSDGSGVNAQNIVWDNENASMQDKSYAFDEETTDADYDVEDDLEFEDDNDSGSGQESRYS